MLKWHVADSTRPETIGGSVGVPQRTISNVCVLLPLLSLPLSTIITTAALAAAAAGTRATTMRLQLQIISQIYIKVEFMRLAEQRFVCATHCATMVQAEDGVAEIT